MQVTAKFSSLPIIYGSSTDWSNLYTAFYTLHLHSTRESHCFIIIEIDGWFNIEEILLNVDIKGNAQLIFLCNPQKSLVNVCLMKMLKRTVTKKVIVCFDNLDEENF